MNDGGTAEALVYVQEQELLDTPPPASPIQEGTVGWAGRKEITELGREAGDGITLVRVTLFCGHAQGKPVTDEGFANGYQLLCRIDQSIGAIPRRGQRVIVAIPGTGFDGRANWETPGAGVIFSVVGTSPAADYGREKMVIDASGKALVIRARTITLDVEDDDGNKQTLGLSPGLVDLQQNGSGIFIHDGTVTMKALDPDGNMRTAVIVGQDNAQVVDLAGNAWVKLSDGDVTTVASGKVWLSYASSLLLGQTPNPAMPLVVGLTGQTGVGSTKMFSSG